MSFKGFTFSFLLILVSTFTFAQSELAASDADAMIPALTEVSGENVFSIDPDGNICFIDFMKIDGYAKQLVVKDENGNVVLDEAVWELPENTMYELDYDDYKSGKYTVEIQTYKTAIKQKIEVK